MRQAMMWSRPIIFRDSIFAGSLRLVVCPTAQIIVFLDAILFSTVVPRHVGSGFPFCQITFRNAAEQATFNRASGRKTMLNARRKEMRQNRRFLRLDSAKSYGLGAK
jgi:hypothetical protein